jgi:hypothetical protein
MLRLVALVFLLATSTAFAQTSQFPGVAPAVPSPFTPPPQLGGAPAPPVALAVPRVSPNLQSSPSQLVTRPHGRPVEVPGGPSNFSNQVERCLDAAAGAGLGPNQRAAFTRRCVQ